MLPSELAEPPPELVESPPEAVEPLFCCPEGLFELQDVEAVRLVKVDPADRPP